MLHASAPRRSTPTHALPLLAAAFTCATASMLSAGGTTSQVSVATGGEMAFCSSPEVFCYSITASISDNGRYVSFSSVAGNLVGGPLPTGRQVYLHDRLGCQTIRISQTPSGDPANGASDNSSVTADGRYVAFQSNATNILPDVTAGVNQIYLRDTQTNETTLISRGTDGQPGNGSSAAPTITPDGRYIVFQSGASNLVVTDTNGYIDIFVHDVQTQSTVRVNVTDDGKQALSGHSRRATISPDGRFVGFDSHATNFADNVNSFFQVYLHDRDANETGVFDQPGGISTSLVSQDALGNSANNNATWASITDDGQLVAFVSSATNLVDGVTNGVLDVFVVDRETGNITRESVGPQGQQGSEISFGARISGNGDYVSFHSGSPQFLGGGFPLGYSHIFRRDRHTGELEVISVDSDGELATNTSEHAVMTPNGQTFAFSSTAQDLVPNHSNPWADVYVRSLTPADINGDGVVDVSDLLLLLSAWGESCTMADLNDDGNVNVSDLLLLLSNWG